MSTYMFHYAPETFKMWSWDLTLLKKFDNLTVVTQILQRFWIFILVNLSNFQSSEYLKFDFTRNLRSGGSKIIKFQQSQALTLHFESFWSIVYSLLRNFLFPCIGRPWNGVRRLHPFTVCFWTDVQALQRPICNFWSNYHYSGHLACLCDWLISSVACNEDWTLTYTYLLHGSTKCCRSDLLELDFSHLKTTR